MTEIYTAIIHDKPKLGEVTQTIEIKKVMYCTCDNCSDGTLHCIDFEWDAPDEYAAISGGGEAALVVIGAIKEKGGLS